MLSKCLINVHFNLAKLVSLVKKFYHYLTILLLFYGTWRCCPLCLAVRGLSKSYSEFAFEIQSFTFSHFFLSKYVFSQSLENFKCFFFEDRVDDLIPYLLKPENLSLKRHPVDEIELKTRKFTVF